MARRSPRNQSKRNARGSGPVTDAQADQAWASLEAGRTLEAEAQASRVLAESRDHPIALRVLAALELRRQSPTRAIELLERAIRRAPMRAELHGELGLALQASHQSDRAITSYERAVAIRPDYVQAYRGLAEIHERRRSPAEAHKALLKAAEVDPRDRETTLHLAQVERSLGAPDAARDRLLKIAGDGTADPVAAEAHAELGRLADRAADYRSAISHFERSKAIFLALDPMGDTPAHAPIESRRATFDALTADRLERWHADRESIVNVAHDGAPRTRIFLVGFPRSGTTLTEQIASAHPSVVSTDETDLLERLVAAIGGPGGERLPAATTLDRLTQHDIARLRSAYDRAAAQRAEQPITGKVLIDKMPLNILYLPELCRVFPDARLIVARRDPRDVAVSCYTTLGGTSVAARAYLSWQRIADLSTFVAGLWLGVRDRCPLPTLDWPYEQLVHSFEPMSRSLIEFLGLAFDDRVLNFHEERGGAYVASPTYQAARSPVSPRAIGRWHHYREAMGDTLARLEEIADRFGTIGGNASGAMPTT